MRHTRNTFFYVHVTTYYDALIINISALSDVNYLVVNALLGKMCWQECGHYYTMHVLDMTKKVKVSRESTH